MAMHNGDATDSAKSMKTLLRNLPSLKEPFHPVDVNALPDTPQEAFKLWLNDAVKAGVKEPHAMTLSTVDENGWPDARVLILKNLDTRGWHFAIQSGSPKGKQIAGNPRVALTFYWSLLGRQVRLRGEAHKLPATECAQDFLERPAGAKVAAMSSRQSQVLSNTIVMDQGIEKARAELEENPDYVVSGWSVYAVAPDIAEFWQGSPDRLHRRLRYMRSDEAGSWRKEKLWP